MLTTVKAINALNLPSIYSSNVTIIDAYPGLGVWSAALHNTIRPANHILLEPHINYKSFLASLESPQNTWRVRSEDPFRWGTFRSLSENKIYTPTKLSRREIHNQLLFTANLSMIQGEQLCVQYLNCITNHSWLQAYGRVKLLLWVREPTAAKLMAVTGTKARHRVSVQCEATTKTTAIIGEKFMDTGSPLICGSREDFHPAKTDMPVLIEMDPLEHQVEYIDSFEYVIKMLFILRTKSLSEALSTLGPGAVEDLAPQLQDMLQLKPQEMSLDQIQRIVKAFELWPFKPDFLHDFYEESALGQGGGA
jgi:transcription factor 1